MLKVKKNAEFHIAYNVRVFFFPIAGLINRSQLYLVQNKYTGGRLIKLPGLLRFNLLSVLLLSALKRRKGTQCSLIKMHIIIISGL